ncbi:MAG: polysaccharide biosynthesis tyrosine autokinase [Calditrichia bacterium]|nr:polysaccharide biosynthesis tyrosine autokinase [Calditrichia bacterium]
MFEEEQLIEEQQVSLQDYARILYRGKWIILFSFIIVLILTTFITFTTDPVYEAKATVLIQGSGAKERMIFDDLYFGNQSTMITNQIEILKSRSLAKKVLETLDLSDFRDSLKIFQPNEDGEIMSLRQMTRWFQENLEISHRKDTDLIDIIFSAGSAFECLQIANVTAVEFRLLNASTNKLQITELREFLEEQIEKKGEELKRAEEDLREYQEREKVASLDDETTQLVERFAHAETMLQEAQIELNSAQERKQSLVNQIEERKISLQDDLSEISTPYLISLQNQLAEAVAEKSKYEIALRSEISNPNKLSFESQVKGYDDKINAIRDKLKEESQKIQSSSMVKDVFQLSQGLITNLLETETEIKSLIAKIGALQGVVSDYDYKLESLPDKILQLARLERKRKVQETTFILMKTKLEETKIQEAGQSKNVSILDEAIAPLFPVKPNKKLNLLLGALIGLGLGVAITFLKEYFDDSLKSPEEIEKLGFNLLAAIPKIEVDEVEKKAQKKWELTDSGDARQIESRLITHFDPRSPVSEAYRTLRTNLQFSKIESSIKSILVTSSGPKEGKSTSIANLAITLAQMGSKVVLVDTDLRRPVIHSIFGHKKEEGLTNYMMDQIPIEKVIKGTIIDNLKIITSGVLPPNPSELLGSKKMEDLIAYLKENFDLILFDSPPVIAVTDAAVLSTKVDCVFLVVSSGQTNKDAIARATTLLENVKARVLGVVLNNVDYDNNYGSSYYQYYHYYYGAQSKRKKRKIRKS